MPHQSDSSPAGSQRYLQILFSIISLFILTLTLSPVNATPLPPHDELPTGLSASDWASIQAQIKAHRYHAQAQDDGSYQALNPAQGWRIDYRSDGVTELVPNDAGAPDYHISFRLKRIGYGDKWQPMPAHPQQLEAQQDILDYHWSDTLIERWANSEAKLEQWFLLSERPPGAESGQPLQLHLMLDSDLAVSQTGNALQFSHDSGVRIRYDRLKVWDADGQIQTAWLQLDDQQINLLIDDQHARYPLTIDPTLQQQAYLKASNTGAGDQFGWSLAADGNTIVVGAVAEDSSDIGVNGDEANNSANDSGAAYVFIRSGGVWSQQAYLKASNTQASDRFGTSVAISGDTIVVGARGEDSNDTGVNGDEFNNSAGDSGAAYVFTRSGGVWSQQAYLKASNTGAGDLFGWSVAVSGDTIVVGALGEASNATGVNGDEAINTTPLAGAAYVFTRNAGVWSQQAYLKASNTESNDQFSYSVAISGDTIVVGAIAEDSDTIIVNGDEFNNALPDSGAAYVFTRVAGSWSQQAYLKAFNTGTLDQFGHSVAIDGETLVVGALGEASDATGVDGDGANNFANNSGAAYVFTRNVGVWSQQAYLKASNTDSDDQFGYSVAIDGNTIAVGATGEDSGTTGVDGDQADDSTFSSGATYVFTRSGFAWSQQSYLKASNTDANDQFGYSVAISGDNVFVGAHLEDSNATGVNGDETSSAANNSGAVYVFDTAFLVGGTLSGLSGGQTVVLQNNGADDLSLTANGAFTFATALADASAYNVTVSTQPDGQTCTVTNASGTIGSADVTNVTVDCVLNTYAVSGNLSGLTSGSLVLQNNSGDDLMLTVNGPFTFATELLDNSAYNVTVLTQPVGHTCTVANGSGNIDEADITDVAVDCVLNTYSVSGNLNGLSSGSLVLQNNGGDDLTLSANGAFTFATVLEHGSAYNVTVQTQPLGQTCTVTNGSGNINGADVTDVVVDCVLNTYTVGGNLNGLISGSLVLQNNAGDDLTLTTDGAFTFATEVIHGGAYNVTVLTQPLGHTCMVTNGNGTINGADVTDVAVSCVLNTYTVSGNLNGLSSGSLVLQNNAGDDLTLTADGAFTFATALNHGSGYNVTVQTQPLGQTCTVSNGSGTINGADVSDVTVDCVLNSYTVGGNLNGLASGSIVLQNNGADDLTLTADGPFTFATAVIHGGAYNVTILTQPVGHTCTVTNDGGTINGADVTDVAVDCVLNTHTISGNLSGLASGSIVLQNNNGDDLTLTADGVFTFATAINHGSAYNVSVLTQPLGHTCTVTNGSGSINAADVTDVAVDCVLNSYTIGGNLSGLTSGSLVLQNNAGDDLTLTADGPFTFATALDHGSSYNVTILTQPVEHVCTIDNGSGSINGADITDVTVNCVLNSYTVGGNLNGLASGSIVLQNNGGDDLTLTADGAFTFATAINHGSAYDVTILTQPVGHTCIVTNGSGTINGADVSDVVVDCVLNSYTVGGNLSGLSSDSIVLQNNGVDDLTLAADGAFTFAIVLDHGSAYDVTILTQPVEHTCTLTNGSGIINGADVTDIEVDCVLNTYTVAGNLSGLAAGQTLVLQNNDGDDLSLTADGVFTFATALINASAYNVTVLTQPSGQICTVTNGSGVIASADVTDVAISCISTYSIGGTLTGLANGQTVVLQNNGGDDLTLSADGTFTFASVLNDGSDYDVTILTQPDGQVCTVSNGNGTLAGANVTDVAVSCINTYSVGGTLTGLASGQTVVLQNNGADDLSLSADGAFTFATVLEDGSDYEVTVLTQPDGQACTVTNGNGTLAAADITDVAVNCVDAYSIGGTLNGLASAETLVLQNNGADDLTLSTDGAFTFATLLEDGSDYDVTILTQPSGQVCTVSNGSGTLAGADVTDVVIDCISTYSVAGTLSGLASGQTIVLQNNGVDDLSLSADGAFTFATVLNDGSNYDVTILTQPSGQVCTVTNGSGTLAGADVTDVAVDCISTYSIGGTLSGLASGQTIVLQNNSGDDLTLTVDSAFTFATVLNDGSDYEVTILTQPSGQACTVSNGSGTLAGADVTDVVIDCINTYSVGGTLTGLATGETVVLQNNGSDDLTLTVDGAFTFANVLEDGSDYEVTILTQASGQVCTVTNGSGTLAGADVSDVAVNCTFSSFTISGTLSGLATGETVVLQNNGGDDLTLTVNGAFTFATELDNGSAYNITVLSHPTDQACTVTNGSGTLDGVAVSDVAVSCGGIGIFSDQFE